ncbi:hypothetical protein EVAR_32879_1 [Eumeta japonica]|uniref:Uncharacterized protein n=1 Tax=Eumeta variegata TaxID=151549 RepID=A0A4C1VPL4_EUMVA|nr:hypothetical protein EVAR_32879_1 [Eumeta japonica]
MELRSSYEGIGYLMEREVESRSQFRSRSSFPAFKYNFAIDSSSDLDEARVNAFTRCHWQNRTPPVRYDRGCIARGLPCKLHNLVVSTAGRALPALFRLMLLDLRRDPPQMKPSSGMDTHDDYNDARIS